MKIVFIANSFKTVFFHALVQGLEKHEVYWITPSKRWGNWLIGQGVVSEKILDVTIHGEEWTKGQRLNKENIEALAHLENCSGLLTHNIILMDRLLSKKPPEYGLNYLAAIHKYIEDFLLSHKIEIIFSERSCAIELLTYQIGNKLQLLNFSLAPVRIPSGRFAFFYGFAQSKIARVRNANSEDYKKARSFYEYYLNKKPKPSYYLKKLKSLKPFKIDLEKTKKRIRYVGDRVYLNHEYIFDESKQSLLDLIKYGLSRVLNSQINMITYPFVKPQNIAKKRPFVLYTLHLQPEASIDVFGSYFSNQIELIKTLARGLPITHSLYVKEHTAAIGARSLADYNNIKSMPGVYLIEPSADTFQLISEADLVISVSGTALYEAALLGRPAISIVPMFFGSLLTVNGMNPYETPLAKVLSNMTNVPEESNGEEQIEFLAQIIAQSFPGEIGDSLTTPDCLLEENIKNVTEGISIFLDSYCG